MNTRDRWLKWTIPLRQRLLPLLRQMTFYWRGLTRRERQQVFVLSAVLAGALVWLLFTRPALNTLSHWQQALPRLRAQQAALQQVLADAGGGQIRNGLIPVNPEQRLAQSLAAAGLADGYQLRADGAGWVLRFTQPVEAQKLVNWLLNTAVTTGMTVQQVSMARIDAAEPGQRVTASVTLAVQQKGKGE